MRYLAISFAALLFAFAAMADDGADLVVPESEFSVPHTGDTWLRPEVVLFENGPLINCAGCGVGGADESILLSVTLGMNTLGFGHQADPSIDNRIADDFTVPTGEQWDITTITTFAYQSNAPSSPSPINGVYIEVWDGVPGVSNRVWGDIDTNYMDTSVFANVYRVTETTTGQNTARAVMASESVPSPALLLDAGTYYMAWQSSGNPAYSGPWANPIAETDTDGVTGNGLQSITGGPYDPALDSGIGTQQGFPFLLEGDIVGGTPTQGASWSEIKSTFHE